MAQVRTQVFVRRAEEMMYNGSEFINFSRNWDAYVVGENIEIPQSGTLPKLTVNRASYPIPMIQREDTKLTIPIDRYSSDGITIPETDKAELSYSVVDSI